MSVLNETPYDRFSRDVTHLNDAGDNADFRFLDITHIKIRTSNYAAVRKYVKQKYSLFHRALGPKYDLVSYPNPRQALYKGLTRPANSKNANQDAISMRLPSRVLMKLYKHIRGGFNI